ncbi:MAG: hypothetical protein ABSF80_00075 [Chitinispirillaceae bacterium]
MSGGWNGGKEKARQNLDRQSAKLYNFITPRKMADVYVMVS